MPNGKRWIRTGGAVAGRSALLTTDEQLQLGPRPDRIDRPQSANNTGKIGPNVNGFPMTYGMEYVGAVPLVHVAQGVAIPPTTAIDDRAAVPAVYAGNPLP